MEVGTAIRAEERKGEVGLLPVLARNCERPEILGLRTPTDFTESYDVGLEDLLARLSAPKRTAPVDQDNHAVLVASEAAATTLQHSLTEIRERLSLLSPQQFEELVAEQFRKHFDLEVTLTSKTRDGGVDIIALGGKDGRDHPILIQCKRYSPRKQVGVEVVRSLFGTMALHGVNRGIVVTTSHFTKQATDEARRVREMCRDRWTLDLIDSDALVNWLAHSPALGPNVTTPLTQLRLRYVNLVDKKYTGGLSPEEEAERGRLATALEEADAALYEPLKEALVRERDRLLKAKEDHGRES
jgi:HJR/Mrr/RecB family endonuclease